MYLGPLVPQPQGYVLPQKFYTKNPFTFIYRASSPGFLWPIPTLSEDIVQSKFSTKLKETEKERKMKWKIIAEKIDSSKWCRSILARIYGGKVTQFFRLVHQMKVNRKTLTNTFIWISIWWRNFYTGKTINSSILSSQKIKND